MTKASLPTGFCGREALALADMIAALVALSWETEFIIMNQATNAAPDCQRA